MLGRVMRRGISPIGVYRYLVRRDRIRRTGVTLHLPTCCYLRIPYYGTKYYEMRQYRQTLICRNAAAGPQAPGGSQTLLRGLDVIEAVVDGPIALAELAARLGLTRSTDAPARHRAGRARAISTFVPRLGYQFGPKLLELGFLAQQQTDIVQLARPHLEALAAATEDTVHLGVLDGDRALYLDKIPGRRRVEISSRVGERHPLTSTGLGKALLLDDDPARIGASCSTEDQAQRLAAGRLRRLAGADARLCRRPAAPSTSRRMRT